MCFSFPIFAAILHITTQLPTPALQHTNRRSMHRSGRRRATTVTATNLDDLANQQLEKQSERIARQREKRKRELNEVQDLIPDPKNVLFGTSIFAFLLLLLECVFRGGGGNAPRTCSLLFPSTIQYNSKSEFSQILWLLFTCSMPLRSLRL